MKDKWIFIGIGILLIMAIGVIVFLHFTAPEVLTKTPFELVTGRDIRDRVNDVPPVPKEKVDKIFIVSDNLWQNASRLANADGVEGRGGVQFVVPVGTKLHAPVDRWHVHVGSMVLKGVSFSAITLSKSPDWNFEVHTQSVWFMSRWIEVTNFNPRKGEVFAEVKDAVPFPPANADGKSTLVVAVDSVWAQKSDRSIEDPRTYLRTIIEKIN